MELEVVGGKSNRAHLPLDNLTDINPMVEWWGKGPEGKAQQSISRGPDSLIGLY